MHIYHIYFNLKDQDQEDEVTQWAIELAKTLEKAQAISSYTLEKNTGIGNFDEMLDYHMTISFDSEEHMNAGFALVKEKYMQAYPHKSLMSCAAQFKVSFSTSLD